MRYITTTLSCVQWPPQPRAKASTMQQQQQQPKQLVKAELLKKTTWAGYTVSNPRTAAPTPTPSRTPALAEPRPQAFVCPRACRAAGGAPSPLMTWPLQLGRDEKID